MRNKRLSKDYGLSTMPGLALREKYLTKKSKPMSLNKTEYNPFQTEADVDNYLKHGHFALLTGHKSNLSSEQSKQQHDDLIATLEKEGHKWQHVGGKWLGGPSEPTVMVHDISPDDATRLARQFFQTAHIQSSAGLHKEHSHEDSHKPPEGGRGHIIGNHLEDNYSEVALPNGKKVRFQLNVGYPMAKSDNYDSQQDSPEGMYPEDAPVKVTFGSGKHRQLRRHLESLPEGKAHKKDLEAVGYDLKSMGLSPYLSGRGELHHSSISHAIDKMPKMVYGVTHDTYGEESDSYNKANEEQRHSLKPSEVFQLNYTPDHEKQMKDAGVLDTFHNMINASKYSGHPIGDRTLGWLRYTKGDDGNHHIDEVQSDFGQSFVTQGANQIKQAMSPEGFNANGQTIRMSPEQGAAHLEKLKRTYPDEHFNKISQILFGGKHPNEVVHEAFLQHLRNTGNEGKQIHIWDAESKGKISGQKQTLALPAHMQFTYKQSLPKMGYKEGGKYGQIATQDNPNLQEKATHVQTLAKKDYFTNLLQKTELSKAKNTLLRDSLLSGAISIGMAVGDTIANKPKAEPTKQVKIQEAKQMPKPKIKKDEICIPKDKMVEEHKELVDTLKHPTKEKLQSEAKEQSKELKGYVKKGQDPLAAELTPAKGVSEAGIEARRADPRQKGVVSHGYGRVTTPEKHGERAKSYFRDTLNRLKAQPKPNLPKSEKKLSFEDIKKSVLKNKPFQPVNVAGVDLPVELHDFYHSNTSVPYDHRHREKAAKFVADVWRKNRAEGERMSSKLLGITPKVNKNVNITDNLSKNDKYVHVSQDKDIVHNGKPNKFAGKHLTHVNDLKELKEYHGRDMHKFTNKAKPGLGDVSYKVGSDGSLTHVKSNYDTSD